MCGRVAIPGSQQIIHKFKLFSRGHEWTENVNTAPTDYVPVISSQDPKTLDYKRWSLIPWYTKPDPKTGKPDQKISTFNARYERLLEPKSIWYPLMGKNHCVVIVNGYYEWEWLDEKGTKKQPYFIKEKGEDFTLLAGLWSDWVNKQTGKVITSCAVITHDAVESMGKIHDRMPAFLTKEGSDIWLNNKLPLEVRMNTILPVPEGFLEAVKINKVGDLEEFEHVVFH